MVRGRDVDATGADRHTVRRVLRGQRARPRQNVGQHAWRRGRDVHDNEDRGREVGRQPSHQLAKSLDPARRGADDDDVTRRHAAGAVA